MKLQKQSKLGKAKKPRTLMEHFEKYKGIIKLPDNMDAVEYLRKYSR